MNYYEPRLTTSYEDSQKMSFSIQFNSVENWIYSSSNIISNTHIHAHPHAPCGVVVTSVIISTAWPIT